jgi:hypothetical protein
MSFISHHPFVKMSLTLRVLTDSENHSCHHCQGSLDKSERGLDWQRLVRQPHLRELHRQSDGFLTEWWHASLYFGNYSLLKKVMALETQCGCDTFDKNISWHTLLTSLAWSCEGGPLSSPQFSNSFWTALDISMFISLKQNQQIGTQTMCAKSCNVYTSMLIF